MVKQPFATGDAKGVKSVKIAKLAKIGKISKKCKRCENEPKTPKWTKSEEICKKWESCDFDLNVLERAMNY